MTFQADLKEKSTPEDDATFSIWVDPSAHAYSIFKHGPPYLPGMPVVGLQRTASTLCQVGDLYHGTDKPQDLLSKQTFDWSKIGERDHGYFGKGFYCFSEVRSAKNYGKYVLKIALKPGSKLLCGDDNPSRRPSYHDDLKKFFFSTARKLRTDEEKEDYFQMYDPESDKFERLTWLKFVTQWVEETGVASGVDWGVEKVLTDPHAIAKIEQVSGKGFKNPARKTAGMNANIIKNALLVDDQKKLAAWSGSTGSVESSAQALSLILVYLRALAIIHQAHHWQTRGPQFYADHELFDRLYNDVVGEIDSVAERIVGSGGQGLVNPVDQSKNVAALVELLYQEALPSPVETPADYVEVSKNAEIKFLYLVNLLAEKLKQVGDLTRGTDNLLAGVEDKHEEHVYLLTQRVKVASLPNEATSDEAVKWKIQ